MQTPSASSGRLGGVSCQYPRFGAPIVRPAPDPPPDFVLPAGVFFLPHQRLSPRPDGVLREFQADIPFVRGDSFPEVVYRSGVRVEPSTYTLTSNRPDGVLNVVTFRDPPLTGDLLVLDAYVMRR